MKNRKIPSPILCAVALSLVVGAPLLSQAEPGVSNSNGGVPAPATAAAGGPAAAPTPAHTTTYTVRTSDTLTSIAEKFHTTRKKLKTLNNLAAGKVKPGQILLVPSTKSAK